MWSVLLYSCYIICAALLQLPNLCSSTPVIPLYCSNPVIPCVLLYSRYVICAHLLQLSDLCCTIPVIWSIALSLLVYSSYSELAPLLQLFSVCWSTPVTLSSLVYSSYSVLVCLLQLFWVSSSTPAILSFWPNTCYPELVCLFYLSYICWITPIIQSFQENSSLFWVCRSAPITSSLLLYLTYPISADPRLSSKICRSTQVWIPSWHHKSSALLFTAKTKIKNKKEDYIHF